MILFLFNNKVFKNIAVTTISLQYSLFISKKLTLEYFKGRHSGLLNFSMVDL